MKRAIEKPVKCIECGHSPVVVKKQFRGDHFWSGQTGWRVFCNSGMHHAQIHIRAHKADAITDWNVKQSRAQKLGIDPAKRLWNFPSDDASSNRPET